MTDSKENYQEYLANERGQILRASCILLKVSNGIKAIHEAENVIFFSKSVAAGKKTKIYFITNSSYFVDLRFSHGSHPSCYHDTCTRVTCHSVTCKVT